MTEAERLFNQGYRGVSNKFRIVARVDQDIAAFVGRDVEAMRRQYGHRNWSSYDFLLRLPLHSVEDWFRRCMSKDKKTVSAEVYKDIKRLETG